MSTKRSILTSASEDRLEKLITERLKAGANKELIDKRIWDLFGEEWCIMFTDLSGFSRNVAKFGIIHFLQTIYESQRVLIPVIDQHDGILLKTEGDSFLVIFRNVIKGLKCAISMQRLLKQYNDDTPEEDDILLCIGLGVGKVLKIGDTDVFGAQVNAASKLGEDTAGPWEILVTGEVKKAVDESGFENIGFSSIPEVPPGAKDAFRLDYKL